MSKRLPLAVVDRLIDTLDRSRSERGPRAEIEKLRRAYIEARRAEGVAHVVYGCSVMGLIIADAAHIYATRSIQFPDWSNLAWLIVISIYLLGTTVLWFAFPILRRRARVTWLLEYFGVDLAQVDSLYARKNMPAAVLAAVETLERAQTPDDLGPAYGVVERWSAKAHGINFDDFYLGFFWVLAVIAAISGEQFGLPDFWRGAAMAFVVITAFQHFLKTQEERGSRRRAEDALGRWRHLVPKMRELPQ